MVPLLAVSLQHQWSLKEDQKFGDPHWTGRDVAAEDNCKERVIEEQSKASKGSKFCPNGAEYV